MGERPSWRVAVLAVRVSVLRRRKIVESLMVFVRWKWTRLWTVVETRVRASRVEVDIWAVC